MYKKGPKVDPTGTTPRGDNFDDVREYKRLLAGELDQIARHFAGQLVTFATGGEVSFADRDEIERILDRTRDEQFSMRTLMHEVIASPLFRER